MPLPGGWSAKHKSLLCMFSFFIRVKKHFCQVIFWSPHDWCMCVSECVCVCVCVFACTHVCVWWVTTVIWNCIYHIVIMWWDLHDHNPVYIHVVFNRVNLHMKVNIHKCLLRKLNGQNVYTTAFMSKPVCTDHLMLMSKRFAILF